MTLSISTWRMFFSFLSLGTSLGTILYWNACIVAAECCCPCKYEIQKNKKVLGLTTHLNYTGTLAHRSCHRHRVPRSQITFFHVKPFCDFGLVFHRFLPPASKKNPLLDDFWPCGLDPTSLSEIGLQNEYEVTVIDFYGHRSSLNSCGNSESTVVESSSLDGVYVLLVIGTFLLFPFLLTIIERYQPPSPILSACLVPLKCPGAIWTRDPSLTRRVQ